jgi:hypothetical protein
MHPVHCHLGTKLGCLSGKGNITMPHNDEQSLAIFLVAIREFLIF